MFKEEVYPGLDLVDLCVLVSMVLGPLVTYFYFSFAVRQMGVNGLLLTLAIPTFLLGACGLLINSEAPTLLRLAFSGLVTTVAESSQFLVAISSILAIPPVVNLVVDGVSSPSASPSALASAVSDIPSSCVCVCVCREDTACFLSGLSFFSSWASLSS